MGILPLAVNCLLSRTAAARLSSSWNSAPLIFSLHNHMESALGRSQGHWARMDHPSYCSDLQKNQKRPCHHRGKICSRESHHCPLLPAQPLNLNPEGSLGWHGAGLGESEECQCCCSSSVTLHIFFCLGTFTPKVSPTKSELLCTPGSPDPSTRYLRSFCLDHQG